MADCPQLHLNTQPETADKALIMTEWRGAVREELPDAGNKWEETWSWQLAQREASL